MQANSQHFSSYSDSAFSSPLTPTSHTPRAYDTRFQIQHLEKMVEENLKQLGEACGEVETLEKDLQSFIDEYYGQVGVFFEQLETLRRETAFYEAEMRSARRKPVNTAHQSQVMSETEQLLKDEFPSFPRDLSRAEIDAEIKDIYRRLMKLYHPDVASEKNRYNETLVQLINRAYARGNLWALREMEHSLVEHAFAGGDTPEHKLQRLRERFEAVSGSISRVRERRQALKTSAAYHLKQRLEREKYLVEVIIHRAKQQIEEARKLLFHKKLEHKALVLS